MVRCQLCRSTFPFEVRDYDGQPVEFWTCPTCIIAVCDRPVDAMTPTMKRRMREESRKNMRVQLGRSYPKR
jgi:hypothetical protein